MLHAKNPELEKRNLFITILRLAINGENRFDRLIYQVISEVHGLSKNRINFFQINSETFGIVADLAESGQEYFSQIDPENPPVEIKEKMLEFLEKESSPFLA